MKIAITGHRPERLGDRNKEVYDWFVEKFKEYKPNDIYTGMARGVDQIAAWAAKDNDYFYTCTFPYKRKSFCPEEEELINGSARVIYCSEKYNGPKTYIDRDEYMVDCSNVLLAVWDGVKEGGTWQTIKYAMQCGKEIIYFPWED